LLARSGTTVAQSRLSLELLAQTGTTAGQCIQRPAMFRMALLWRRCPAQMETAGSSQSSQVCLHQAPTGKTADRQLEWMGR
jgi:hypothetical protein